MAKRANKVGAFVKKHRRALAVTAGTALVGGVIFAVTKQKIKVTEIVDTKKMAEIPEELTKYGVDVFDNCDKYVEILTEDMSVPLTELGAFGEAVCAAVTDGITPESKAYILLNVTKEGTI